MCARTHVLYLDVLSRCASWWAPSRTLLRDIRQGSAPTAQHPSPAMHIHFTDSTAPIYRFSRMVALKIVMAQINSQLFQMMKLDEDKVYIKIVEINVI